MVPAPAVGGVSYQHQIPTGSLSELDPYCSKSRTFQRFSGLGMSLKSTWFMAIPVDSAHDHGPAACGTEWGVALERGLLALDTLVRH